MSDTRSYATQMDAARRGIATPELAAAARHEGISPERLMTLVAEGRAAIPANRAHPALAPRAIGRELSTKINVNLATFRDSSDPRIEMEKVRVAERMGADAIMDLSSFGDTRAFRKLLVET